MAIHSRPAPKQFMVTSELPCPYLPSRFERKLVTELTGPLAVEQYEILSRAGFRRSHSIAYRPACSGCTACVAVRVVVPEFEPSPSLARVLRRSCHLPMALLSPRATREQYTLFVRYLDERGIPALDVTDALRAAAGRGDRTYYWLDIHWTQAGNAAAAEAVAQHLGGQASTARVGP